MGAGKRGAVSLLVGILLVGVLVPAGAGAQSSAAGEGSVSGVRVWSDEPGVLRVAWRAASPVPSDYRVMWAPEGESYKTWSDLSGNAYPESSSLVLEGLDADRVYRVQVRARYYDGRGKRLWSGPWSDVAAGRPSGGDVAGTVLAGTMKWGSGVSGGSEYVGYSLARRTGAPDRAGGFEMRFWDDEVLRSRSHLYALAQIQGPVASGPAAGLDHPVVLTMTSDVDLSSGFMLEFGDVLYASAEAVNPQGDVGAYRYWMWDSPCVRWQAGDEAEFRIVASGPGGLVQGGLAGGSLESLGVAGAALDSPFDPGVLDHFATTDPGAARVEISAVAAQPGACTTQISPPDADGDASNGHQVDLASGETVVSVSVTAADGSVVRTYTLTVSRPAVLSDDATLGGLAVVGAALEGEFDPDMSQYTAQAEAHTARVTVAAEAADAGASVEISPPDADGDASNGHQVDVGDNAITVTVTAADGVTVRVYEVAVTRPPRPPLPTLAALELTDTTLAPQLGPETSHYTAAVTAGANQVTVTAEPSEPGATVEITPPDADANADGHQIDVRSGDAVVSVTLTAADGISSRVYTVAIGRDIQPAAAGRVALSGVDVEFSPTQSRYDTTVPRHLTSTSIDLAPSGASTLEGFTFTAGDTHVTPIGDDGRVALTPGRDTLIAVRAASPGHQRERLYTFRLRPPLDSSSGTRSVGIRGIPTISAAAKSALRDTRDGAAPQLSALAVSVGTLEPAFASAVTEYTLSVPYDTAHLTVTPTPPTGATVTYLPAGGAGRFALNPTQNGQPSQTAVMVIVTQGDSVNRYTINVTRNPASTHEETGTDFAGDTTTTGRIGINEFLKGQISTGGDVDWYKVDLEAGSISFFYMLGDRGEYYNSTGTLSEAWITGIYKADGTQAATPHTTNECHQASSFSGRSPSFSHLTAYGYPLIRCGPTFWEASGSMVYFVPETDGLYYIGVASRSTSNTGTYTLIQRERYTGDQAAHHSSYGTHPHAYGQLTIGETTAAFLEFPLDRDNFQVELTAGRRYRFMGSRASDVMGRSLAIEPGVHGRSFAVEDVLNWSGYERCRGPHLRWRRASFMAGDIWRVSTNGSGETVYHPVHEAVMCFVFDEFTATDTGTYIIQVFAYNNDGTSGWGGYKVTVIDITDD